MSTTVKKAPYNYFYMLDSDSDEETPPCPTPSPEPPCAPTPTPELPKPVLKEVVETTVLTIAPVSKRKEPPPKFIYQDASFSMTLE